jgi:hypothetical protein
MISQSGKVKKSLVFVGAAAVGVSLNAAPAGATITNSNNGCNANLEHARPQQTGAAIGDVGWGNCGTKVFARAEVQSGTDFCSCGGAFTWGPVVTTTTAGGAGAVSASLPIPPHVDGRTNCYDYKVRTRVWSTDNHTATPNVTITDQATAFCTK